MSLENNKRRQFKNYLNKAEKKSSIKNNTEKLLQEKEFKNMIDEIGIQKAKKIINEIFVYGSTAQENYKTCPECHGTGMVKK